MYKIEVRKQNGTINITNDKYENGVNHLGVDRFPDIGVEYVYLQCCSEAFAEDFYVDETNAIQAFTEEQKQKLIDIIKNWEQELGQEGNPTREQSYYSKLADINKEFETKVKDLSSYIPESEKLTWDKQEEEARKYLSDAAEVTPFLDIVCSMRGVTKEYLANKIIEKTDIYVASVGALLGEKHKKEDLLETEFSDLFEIEEV